MKKLIMIVLLMVGSLFTFGQFGGSSDNYKEGWFPTKGVGVNSIWFPQTWAMKVNPNTKALTWYYNGTSIATMSTAGVFAPSISAASNFAVTGHLTATTYATLGTYLTLGSYLTINGHNLAKTTGNDNSITYAGSIAVATGDSISAPNVYATTLMTTATASATTSVTTPRVIVTAVAASDTSTKIVGFKVIGTQLYFGNGTYYYKIAYSQNGILLTR